MKRLLLIGTASLCALTIMACGEETPQLACQKMGTDFTVNTQVYSDDEGQEARCDDGREVEDEGYGWVEGS